MEIFLRMAGVADNVTSLEPLRRFVEDAHAEDIEPEIDPTDLDFTFWGIKPEVWMGLTYEERQKLVAEYIAQDIGVLNETGIEPEVWMEMSLDERQSLMSPAHDQVS